MTVTVKMVAPVAGQSYTTKGGTTYTADVNGIINSVAPGDIESLLNMACNVVVERPIVTPVVSSYIVQGAINIVSSSTAADAFTLAAPAYLGMKTSIIDRSTGVPTVTSSGADILTSTGGVCTVLTGTTKGTIDLESVGSTQWQIMNRSGATSSAGAAFVNNWASS